MRAASEGSATVAGDIIRHLRRDIVDGRLEPGAKLKFADLQTRYEAGIGTLREALVTLAGEGIVTLDSRRGFRVAEVSAADLRDLVDLRVEIERRAIRDSVRHGDEEWEAGILASWHRLSKVAGMSFDDRLQPGCEWVSRHRDFHFALVAGCRSKRLLGFRNILYDQAERYRLLSVRHGELQEDEHDALRDAALARDVEKAGELLVKHIVDSADYVLRYAPQLKDR